MKTRSVRGLAWLRSSSAIVVVCASLLLQNGCGAGSQPQSSVIMLNSVSPLPTMNNPAFTMTVNGSGFIAGAMLLVGGSTGPVLQLQTTVVSPVKLTAAIQANAFTISEATFQIYSPNTPCNNQYCSSQWSGILSVPVSP
jgi:hypothetical protein